MWRFCVSENETTSGLLEEYVECTKWSDGVYVKRSLFWGTAGVDPYNTIRSFGSCFRGGHLEYTSLK